MIRQILRPTTREVTIKIPESYVGEEVEFLLFPIGVSAEESSTSNAEISSLQGVFHQYANPEKRKIEATAWQDHIVKEYAENG